MREFEQGQDGEPAIVLAVGVESDAVRASLAGGEWRLCEARDPIGALRTVYADRPQALVLAAKLPEDRCGVELLAEIRKFSDAPALVLDSPSEEIGVRALRAGADQLADHPGASELQALVEALLRRADAIRTVRGVVEDSLVRLDPWRHDVEVRGEPVSLTPTEFQMLAVFAAHPGRTLRHPELLERVWGDTHRGIDEVKLYVSYLRRKLEPAGVDPVVTVRGVGYRYEPRVVGM